MSNLRNSSGKEKVFVPFTLDKRFWNKKIPNVFLDKVYEEQIEKGEEIRFTTMLTSYTYKNDKNFQDYCTKVTDALGKILNRYHGVNESNRFWEKMLYLWIVDYSASIRFKIEQLNNFVRGYPEKRYSYYSCAKKNWKEIGFQSVEVERIRGIFWEEEYHYISYLWLAQNYYDFQFEEKSVEGSVQSGKRVSLGISKYINNLCKFFRRMARSLVGRALPASRLRVGIYKDMVSIGRLSAWKWLFWSFGAIQKIIIPPVKNTGRIDICFRESLTDEILNYITVNEEEKMILEFLPKVLPSFFVEDFKAHYNVARQYLSEHPNLKLIHTMAAMMFNSTEKICMLLLQERGGKIIGQQHGGTYQVAIDDYEIFSEFEFELDDIFYYWGKSALLYKMDNVSNCEISFAPSYRLKGYGKRSLFLEIFAQTRNPMVEYILFTGTALFAYPRSSDYGNITTEKEEYMERKMRFLSNLSDEARRMTIVREYPHDYGWHMGKKIKMEFPMMRISTRELFDDVLKNCCLFISDHLATTWIQALYAEKPVIFLLFDHEISIQIYKFRKEEKSYIDMLAEVGIIIYSPEDAARLVNYLVKNGIKKWWMDEERQRVVRLVKERWTTKVDDIDKWWCRELMTRVKDME